METSKISTTKFSNLPVYKNGELIGVANGQKILNALGEYLSNHEKLDEFIANTQIEKIVGGLVDTNYYTVLSSETTIDQVLGAFLANRKLLAIIITKTGTMHEPPLAIITSTDYMELNKILENY